MNSAPAIGSIRLYDSAAPDMPAGEYRLKSALEITQTNSGAALGPPPAFVSHFHVTGPRFTLAPVEIAGQHPPTQGKGAFADRLPHVTLTRRTLPWERAAADGTPWLALLVFTAAEASLASGTVRTLLPAGVVATIEARDPIDGDPQVTVVRVNDLATFRAVLPSRTDVGLLCHVRQVNIADSALAGSDDDGWFAVVAANRLPLAPDGMDAAYMACLVSLEARDDVWQAPNGQAPPPLIVLHSWKFTSSAEGGTFEQLANNLDVGAFGAPEQGMAPVLDDAGFIPMQLEDRQGVASTVRYRGPLLGVVADKPLGSAGADISVIAAFELGRLLGAADARFLRELVAWHRADESRARSEIVARDLARAIAPPQPARERAARTALLQTITSDDLIAAVHERLASVAGRPANLWQAHPAGLKSLAAKPAKAAKPRKRAAARSAAKKKTRGGKS